MKSVISPAGLILVVAFSIAGFFVGHDHGYDDGQKDALRGKQMFELKVKYDKVIVSFEYVNQDDTSYERLDNGMLYPWIEHSLEICDTNYGYIPVDTIFLKLR
jgi:hypothetical protein